MKSKLLLLASVAMLLLASCTEAFRHKMEVAEKYTADMDATSVVCGASTSTNNGVTTSMTTLTFSGCDPDVDDADREWAANRVAKEFYGEMTEKDLEGETHLQIIAEAGTNKSEYLFDLDDLKEANELLGIAKEAVTACLAADTSAIGALKDDNAMPDDQMYQIYNVVLYNDSLYEDEQLKPELLGYRFLTGVEDPDLKMLSVDYDASGTLWHTRYTINVDLETKKVVYIWLKTM